MSHTEEYEKAAEAVRVKTDGVIDAIADEETSNDMFMQVLQECSEVCKLYDVPQEDRLDLIFDCIREEAIENIDRAIDEVKWQFEAMRDL